jgi:hypothetical protein
MWIQYQSDREKHPRVMTYAEFVAFFDEATWKPGGNGGWQFHHSEADMRLELESRGWYEGHNDFGRYLVLNLEKLQLQAGLARKQKVRWMT